MGECAAAIERVIRLHDRLEELRRNAAVLPQSPAFAATWKTTAQPSTAAREDAGSARSPRSVVTPRSRSAG